ncbi:alanine racemase [Alteromonas gilva]|uniref:Alanine racemase n=1 Tax=Alteromonas gilva TaxID=2987522 RepID=A0ABT5L578_9ALTE|nr:alanine racemase [Alteromonas gilva]MDC8832201.1 alanine racemase [Alteromonas gilva]
MSRSTRAIIDPDALRTNYRQLKPANGAGAIAVIKADAYGHGAVFVARALGAECDCFAVAICEEAVPLRAAGIVHPVLILEGPHDAEDCNIAARENFILMVHNRYQLNWLSKLSDTKRPRVWLKVDTGMHRLGFAPDEIATLFEEYQWLKRTECVLASHFACADEPQDDFNTHQFARFNEVAETLGLPICMANSAATLTQPMSQGMWCRLGIGLYGASPVNGVSAEEYGLVAAMQLKAQVIALHNVARGESVGYGRDWVAPRDSVIATVGIGYADGYPRHCPSGTPVIIRGQRAPLVGRVSMDMITIDVTGIEGVALQDDVELWGARLPVDEVAGWAGTISYELISRVSSRVPRDSR